MIGKVTNQWTTTLGEHLVAQTLINVGENVRRPKKIQKFKPDLETDKK